MKDRVFIEGASIAGLTAAARLAKFKYQVTISGDTYKNTHIDGYTFDSGPIFSLPAVYRDFFQKTGKHLGQVLKLQPMNPAFVFDFGDLQINFANLSRSARLIEIEAKLGKAAASEWDALLKQGEMMWDRMRENYVEWEFSFSRFNPDTYMRLRAPFISNPYLNKILSHYATHFGYPAGIYKWSHIVAFIEESFGIWQVEGGLEALTGAIKQRTIDCGATFGTQADFDFFIDATQTHTTPNQRLLGLAKYPYELPIRTVIFHEDGLTTDIYSTKFNNEKYSLVLTGKLDIDKFQEYVVVDHLRAGIDGNSDNQVITKIRTANKRRFKVRHVDSLAHAGISGELLANAVRGIKNRPSHEH